MCKNLLFIKVKGVELGEHFYSVVLSRMKKVLAYDKSGISKELKTHYKTSSATPLQEVNTPFLRDTPLQEGNYEVEFEDGTKIDTKDLDYKLIKPLIWWE